MLTHELMEQVLEQLENSRKELRKGTRILAGIQEDCKHDEDAFTHSMLAQVAEAFNQVDEEIQTALCRAVVVRASTLTKKQGR